MEHRGKEVAPHPQFIEALFAHKSKVSTIFKDVLGIHDINHIAIARVNYEQQIIAFSSTPAMEYNLFTSNLWCFDNTYDPEWFKLCTQSSWQSLYNHKHYDELYHIKQVKHHFPTGLSIAISQNKHYYIYSVASESICENTQELFAKHHDLYKIGQYCISHLEALYNLFEHHKSNTKSFHEK